MQQKKPIQCSKKKTYQFELVPIDHNTMKIKWYQFQFAMKE